MAQLLGWILFLAATLTPKQQQDIQDLEEQIRSSAQEKKRHEALAHKYADTAYRLQNNHKLQDAKRFYDMEEQEKEIARYLQMEIDALEKSKAEILAQ